jgi:hypothetical protein
MPQFAAIHYAIRMELDKVRVKGEPIPTTLSSSMVVLLQHNYKFFLAELFDIHQGFSTF